MRFGALILCGGKSSRMGRDKALLPFGPELMLQRVVRLVGEAVATDQIAVVGAVGQTLPELPREVLITRDARPGRGPLEGLAAGLHALRNRADVVFATSCDAPLLMPALIRQLFDLVAENEIVVPRDGDFYHPLSAVYRRSILPTVQKMLSAYPQNPQENIGDQKPVLRHALKENRLRVTDVMRQCVTLEVPIDELRSCDPDLVSFINCNKTIDYDRALRWAGY